MYSDIASAFAGLKALGDFLTLVAKSKVDSAVMQNAVELNSIIIDLQTAISSVHSQNHELLQTKRDLEQKIMEIEKWDTTAEKYVLIEIASGSFAYAIKPDYYEAEPPHWLCTNCYEHREKSILQKGEKIQGGGWVYFCTNCRAQIRSAHKSPADFADKT